MKSILTLKQRLERDRVRKQRYRETMRARGYVQRTVWSSPAAWAKLMELASAVGPGLILQSAAGSDPSAECVTQAVETVIHPAHLSDEAVGGRSP